MKKEIVERLLKAGHINFDEALALMEIQETVVRIETITIPVPQLQPYTPIFPVPNSPWYNPITCDTFTGKETDTSNWRVIN